MSLYRRIEAAASGVQVHVVLQTVALSPFYAVAWVLGFLARLVWGVLLRLWLAFRIGLTDGWSTH
jgi:hypothetical protein